MKVKGSMLLLSTVTLLAFSNSVVHADSAREARISQLEKQKDSLYKANGSSGFEAGGRWYSLKESENKIKELEQQVAQLNVSYSEKNTIKVSAEYAKALKDYFNYDKSEAERNRAEQILKSESSKLRSQEGNFISSASDQVEVYNLNNLPKEVEVELNYFALDMLNQVRSQMGMPQLTLASSSIDFADKLSKKVREANRSVFDWHYVKGINDVAREYGLPTSSREDEVSKYGSQFYENNFAVSGVSSEMTKAEMKQWIYNSILNFLFNGTEFLHAQSVAGVNYGTTNKNEYLGLSLHYLKDGLGISYITVSDADISKATKSVFNTSSPSNTTESNRQATLAKKLKELQDEKDKYEKLQTSYNDYNKIVKEIDSLKSEEEKEKQEKANKDKEKQNTSPDKSSQNQDQNKPSQNQSKPSSSKNGWIQSSSKNGWIQSSSKNGWIQEGKTWYFYKNNQPLRNTWQGSYYLKSDGKMADKEWIYDSYYGSWFYLKAGGAYVNSQWYKVDGSWYYFKSGGYMARNTWLGSYYLKSSGDMAVNEWIYDSNYKAWYYLKSDGSYARNEIVQGKYRVDYSGKWV